MEAILDAVHATGYLTLPTAVRSVVRQISTVPTALDATQRFGRLPATVADRRHCVWNATKCVSTIFEDALHWSARCHRLDILAILQKLGRNPPGSGTGDADDNDDAEQDQQGHHYQFKYISISRIKINRNKYMPLNTTRQILYPRT